MTAAQVQHLLGFLGLYTGPVDGLWGEKSRRAAMDFQTAYGGLTVTGEPGEDTETALRQAVYEGWEGQETGDFWTDIRYFRREEFRCKCGGAHCSGFPAEPQEKLIRAAEKVRKEFGRPVLVTSGVRCEAHNAKVGGVSNSRHLRGKAMDFCVSGVSASQVLPFIQALPEIRYAYRIGRNYIHMDVE